MSLTLTPKKHLLYLDGLRALAAIYVVMHHAVLQYYEFSSDTLSGIKKLSIHFFFYGHYGVDLFIVLSGFSLMLSVINNNYSLKNGAISFFKRRIIRIVPPYYFAVLLSLALIYFFVGNKTGTHWDISIPVTTANITTHLLMIHDFFISSIYTINHSLWSVSVEFRIYFFFPLLVIIWKKKGPLFTLFVACVIALAGIALLLFVHRYNPYIDLVSSGVSPFIILFCVGMLTAHYSFSDQKQPQKIRRMFHCFSAFKTSAIFLIVFIVFAVIRTFFKADSTLVGKTIVSYDVNDIYISLIFALIIFLLSISESKDKIATNLSKFLSWRPLASVGVFSYSLYLIHAPLLQILTQYLITPLTINKYSSCVLLLAIGTPIIICCSYVFYLLFEKPFLLWRKKNSKVL